MTEAQSKARIAVVMGSQSDYATMGHAVNLLLEFDEEPAVMIISAHRTPDRLPMFADARESGLKVIIAGAGGAAHLPGMLAAHTSVPVLGVPVQSKALSGMDSLLSIVQMPSGVPVGTLAIGEAGAKNSALLAIAIVANEDKELAEKLDAWRSRQHTGVNLHPIEAPDVGLALKGADGKTKTLYSCTSDRYFAYAQSKDIVTWGNTHALPMLGKAEWSNEVTCNVFELLRRNNLPVAYRGRVDRRTFKTELLEMFPFEVVGIRKVDPKCSFLKRNPTAYEAHEVLERPHVQFHLKTTGQKYNGRTLPCDDPYMEWDDESVAVYLPNIPPGEQEPIFSVAIDDAWKEFPGFEHVDTMTILMQRVVEVLSRGLWPHGGDLYDIKGEFGPAIRPSYDGKIMIGDVFDADSWRLTVNGERADKQPIRDGGIPAKVEQIAAYRRAVEISKLL